MKEIRLNGVSVRMENKIKKEVAELINSRDYCRIIDEIKKWAILYGSIEERIDNKEKDKDKAYWKKIENRGRQKLLEYRKFFIIGFIDKIDSFGTQVLKLVSMLNKLMKSDDIDNFESRMFIKLISETITDNYIMFVQKNICLLEGIEPRCYFILYDINFDGASTKEVNIFKEVAKTTNMIISEYENGTFGDEEYKEFYGQFYMYLGSARLENYFIGNSHMGIETTTLFDPIKWHNYYNKK